MLKKMPPGPGEAMVKKPYSTAANLLACALGGLIVLLGAFPAWLTWYLQRLTAQYDVLRLHGGDAARASALFSWIGRLNKVCPHLVRILVDYALPILLLLFIACLLIRRPPFARFTSCLFLLFFALSAAAYLPTLIPYYQSRSLTLTNVAWLYLAFGNRKGYLVVFAIIALSLPLCILLHKGRKTEEI